MIEGFLQSPRLMAGNSNPLKSAKMKTLAALFFSRKIAKMLKQKLMRIQFCTICQTCETFYEILHTLYLFRHRSSCPCSQDKY